VEVLPMQRGAIPAALLFGLDREAEHHDHDQHGHEHGHEGHHHDHDHHDHTHVAMQSASLCLSGSFDRSSLELALRQQIEQQSLLRLKGRAWFAGKPHPLQIQAVGPRLECWFDPHTRAAARPPEPGLEVVALGLSLDELAFHRALQALLD
jgi:cobalamin biosynthesis protein CobW